MKKLLMLLVLLPTMFYGDFVGGSTNCPSSGFLQVSSTSYSLYSLTVSAKITNAGFVYVGPSGVTTATGTLITPGSSYSASKPSAAINPTTLYFACATNTDSITWIGSR